MLKIRELDWEFDVWSTLRAWSPEQPLCFLGGNNSTSFLATSFSEWDWEDFKGLTFVNDRPVNCEFPFVSGYIGVIRYDDSKRNTSYPSRVYKVHQGLIFCSRTQKVYFAKDQRRERGQYHTDIEKLRVDATNQPSSGLKRVDLQARCSDGDYINQVAAAIEAIREGRFYQINLLRYFRTTVEQEQISWRLQRYSGPFGCWMRWRDGTEVVSFSPERFFSVKPRDSQLVLTSQPIKGTMPYSDNADHRDSSLLSSAKDLAELRMIVELVRSDMLGVCNPHSVKVLQDAGLVLHPTVQHLQADIEGILPQTKSFQEIFAAMCPGGSISGAPKKEVMTAIQEFEARDRGYFMGNCFSYDPAQSKFDSSILIRTLVKTSVRPDYEYAAGSGITLGSVPQQEAQEIMTKCRVLTDC